MRTNGRVLVLILVALLTAAVGTASAQSRTFTAHLAGRTEVPSVPTNAQGEATLRLSADGMKLEYKITVAGLRNITAAHIHVGAPGRNGPVVVTLFSGMKSGRFSGVLAQGTITAAKLSGSLAGQNLSALITLIRSGRAYVNVHTQRYPSGEIRGQIR